tara:strand:+ start:124 stop:474 length:351 start_codon:yes stop_codon:yes gene_type:complete
MRKKTDAEHNLLVLGLLRNNSETWWPVSSIATKTKLGNESRLTEKLKEMAKRKIVKYWDELPEKERREIQKDQDELKRSKNNFQIAELGIKKYDKIAESCMDDEMRLILNLKDDLV